MKSLTAYRAAVALLIIVYSVGIAGMLTSFREMVLPLSPMNLLLSVVVLIAFQQQKNARFWLSCLLVGLLGYAVEVVGVATGVVFGTYEYGATLGWQIAGVPLVLGVNWLLLVLSSAALSARVSDNSWIRALLGASLMTALDFLIEPVAMALDFWQWEGGVIPWQNYLGWFVSAFILHLLFAILNPKTTNKMARPLFALQVVFFAILTLTIT